MDNNRLRQTLADYRTLLQEVDTWFAGCVAAAAGTERIACRQGCNECCRGLFDITLLDAFLIQEAVNDLEKTILEAARRRAALRRRFSAAPCWPAARGSRPPPVPPRSWRSSTSW